MFAAPTWGAVLEEVFVIPCCGNIGSTGEKRDQQHYKEKLWHTAEMKMNGKKEMKAKKDNL
jgi:hypothetical protein